MTDFTTSVGVPRRRNPGAWILAALLAVFMMIGISAMTVVVLMNETRDISSVLAPEEDAREIVRVETSPPRPARVERETSAPLPKAAPGFLLPAKGRVSSPFGWRRHPITRRRDFHTGVDVAAPRGTPIRAAQDGVVAYSGWMNGYGRTIVVDHGDDYSTLYAHCDGILVKNGQAVRRGEKIATAGSTGNVTGPHLHFEVRRGGYVVDPSFVLK